jgi:hypothetical protein
MPPHAYSYDISGLEILLPESQKTPNALKAYFSQSFGFGRLFYPVFAVVPISLDKRSVIYLMHTAGSHTESAGQNVTNSSAKIIANK